MKFKFVLIVCTLLSTVAMVANSDKFDFLYAGDDDLEATKLLTATLRKTNLDWDVEQVPDTELIRLTTSSSGEFLVQVITFERKTDRILISRLFTPKTGVTDKNTRYLAFANKMNGTYNDLKFYINAGSNANFLMQRTLRFNNRLTTTQLKVLVDDFIESTDYIIKQNFDDGLDEFFN